MTAGRKIISQSQDWCTPPKYVDAIRAFFDGAIQLDPCSNAYSIVQAEVEFMLPECDGLTLPWDYETVFVNPPYGTDRLRGTKIRDWLQKCAMSYRDFNAEVLALVPVATNTMHWKLYVWDAAAGIAFLYDTRLKFLVRGVKSGKGAPMSCAMVYWGTRYQRFEHLFLKFGACVDVRHLHGKNIGTRERALNL